MYTTSILIIGGGNMGAAIANRWRAAFEVEITIAETDAARRAELEEWGFDAPAEIVPPAEGYEVVLLAVKPQNFAALAPSLKDIVGEATLISIMAGVKLDALKKIAPHVARVMPNTPAMIGEGMSVVYAPGLEEGRLNQVKNLFSATGDVDSVDDEKLMHAVTAISGSGPAYLFAFMEALEGAAEASGLESSLARQLVMQTVLGSAILAAEARDVAGLREQVTSPGGTTEAALKALADGGFTDLIRKAVKAAQSRSESLS